MHPVGFLGLFLPRIRAAVVTVRILLGLGASASLALDQPSNLPNVKATATLQGPLHTWAWGHGNQVPAAEVPVERTRHGGGHGPSGIASAHGLLA